MTKKRAFCCLSCNNLPPCNAAAGNCAECCKDCGDTSKCSSSAYFKDGIFYLDYSATVTNHYQQTGDGCVSYYGQSSSSYNLNISSKRNQIWLATQMMNYDGESEDGTYIFIGSDSCGNPSCPGGAYNVELDGGFNCNFPFTIGCADGGTTYSGPDEYTCTNYTCLTKNMPYIQAVNGCNTSPNIYPKNNSQSF